MNKKRGLIIIMASFLFIACFSFVNQKYDRFYRISGIDNEKRQLILNYLSEEEQDYLVENSIGTDRFIKYIELEDFSLFYIQYYETMEDSDKVFLNNNHLIKYTNEVVYKIKSLTSRNITNHFEELVKYGLDDVFLQSENYYLSRTKFYATYKNAFEIITVSDIDSLNVLYEKMEELEYSEGYKRSFLKRWQQYYSVDAITVFLTEKQINPNIELVEYPQSLTAIVDGEHVISSYVPSSLEIPYNVSRVKFAMYLRADAAASLEELFASCRNEVDDETLLLVGAYHSYDEAKTEYEVSNSSVVPGTNEFQLGLTIDVSELSTDYHQFSNTQICQYLKENAWRYGFIQRYSDPTDPNYNEHIYRYVGKPAAKLIYEQQMTLEEYEGV